MRSWQQISARILTALFLLASFPAFAVQPGEMLSDPALEKRARSISAELRCLVCQNQSIDDSDAPLAGDLRRLVRERLQAHDSDQQVLDYIVARYGDFVLLKPPFKPATVLLWASPVIVLLAGIYMALRSRQMSPRKSEEALTAEEQAKISAMLGDERS